MTPHITTVSGKQVNPLDLKPEDIDINDIAAARSSLQAKLDGAGNKLAASGQDGGSAQRRVELNIEAPALSALAP